MNAWLLGLIISCLERVAVALVTRLIEHHAKKTKNRASVKEISINLDKVKSAYNQAFDGTPLTPDQRKQFNAAISDFINSSNPNRL